MASPEPVASPEPERPIELLSLDDFINSGLGTDLIEGVLPERGLLVVQGEACDSLAKDLMMHGAFGSSWHGQAVLRPLRVAYLPGRIHGADRAWLRAWRERADREMPGDLDIIPGLDPYSLPLAELTSNLKSYEPDLLVVMLRSPRDDSLEDTEQSSGEILRSFKELGQKLNCAVLVCDCLHGLEVDSIKEYAEAVIRTDNLAALPGPDLRGSWTLDAHFHYYAFTPREPLPTLTFLGYKAPTFFGNGGVARKMTVSLVELLPQIDE